MTLHQLEFRIALYMMISGIVFLTYPATLLLPVYERWSSLTPTGWGILLISVSMLHFGALRLNGLDRMYSLPVRTIACTVHLATSLTFGALFYLSEAYWGCVLFFFLIPSFLLPIMQSVQTGWFLVIKKDVARHEH